MGIHILELIKTYLERIQSVFRAHSERIQIPVLLSLDTAYEDNLTGISPLLFSKIR